MKTIYCDESGFTGNKLYDAKQPYFVYSSVAVEPEEAKYLIEQVAQDYRIKVPDLKGKNIVQYPRGQRAALWILEQAADNASVVVADKMYALSAKFYEYTFEPVLAKNNSLFYNAQFHRFISNLLYVHFTTRADHAEDMLAGFETALRALRFEDIEQALLAANGNPHLSHFLAQVVTFCMHHKETIAEEIASLRKMPETGSWILELSMTALHSLLAAWGEKYDILSVYCDASKPLAAQSSFFNNMIGRTDRVYIEMAGNRQPLIYNLAGPIQFVNSKSYPGIQVADIFASAIAYSLKNREETFSEQCLTLCEEKSVIHPTSIVPDFKYVDLDEREGFVNALLLQELIERSEFGEDLLDGIGQFILYHQALFPQWQRDRIQSSEEP